MGHRVGCRTQAHPSLVLRLGRPLRHCRGIKLAGERAGAPLDLSVPQHRQLCGERGVNAGPVLAAQAGRLATDDRRPPFADRAGREVAQGVRQLVDHRLGETQMT